MSKEQQSYNVLADMHHASLLNSLIMLFEGRYGGNVYRPIGEEWAEQGYWNVYDHPATQKQFLTLSQGYMPVDGTRPLNRIKNVQKGVYYCQDIDSGKYNKAITLDKFKEMDIDIVIASLPQHVEPFKKLIREYKPKAKLIFQIGNAWTVEAFDAPNVMASAIVNDIPGHINFVSYHQEFNINTFKPSAYYKNKTITSLINVPDNMPDYPLLLELEQQMPDWKFNIYGGQGRDGAKHGTIEVARAIQHTQFIWHVKAGGDGYGHIIFNAYACGKPCIVKKSYYSGKLADKLLIDGETCIDIDGLSNQQIIDKINHHAQVEVYNQMSNKAYQNFKANVDFEDDAIKVSEFLKRLI